MVMTMAAYDYSHGQLSALMITCWRVSKMICRFVLSVFSFCSYCWRRSGTTAIRLNRMSWYGSL